MEQIKGLLTCKPENTPHAGEVRKYGVEQKVGRSGNPWTKISNAQDGHPYTVISVAKTQFESDRGFVSFNLVIEPAQDAPVASQDSALRVLNPSPPHYVSQPSQRVETLSKDDYWTIKDQRDRDREARFVAQQPRIERQHSQGVAVQLAAHFPQMVIDEDGNVNLGKVHTLITWFQRDIGYVPPE